MFKTKSGQDDGETMPQWAWWSLFGVFAILLAAASGWYMWQNRPPDVTPVGTVIAALVVGALGSSLLVSGLSYSVDFLQQQRRAGKRKAAGSAELEEKTRSHQEDGDQHEGRADKGRKPFSKKKRKGKKRK